MYKKLFFESVQQNLTLNNHKGKREKKEMWEIRINKDEMKELMKKLDARKAIGSDGVSGYIMM